MMFEPIIRPVREIDMQKLLEAAQDDNHAVICPTHVVKKDNEFVGYLSVGSVPAVLFWMHTKKVRIRDSIAAVNFYESLVAPAGNVLVPVSKQSPFFPLMEKAGYTPMVEGVMFMKRL